MKIEYIHFLLNLVLHGSHFLNIFQMLKRFQARGKNLSSVYLNLDQIPVG